MYVCATSVGRIDSSSFVKGCSPTSTPARAIPDSKRCRTEAQRRHEHGGQSERVGEEFERDRMVSHRRDQCTTGKVSWSNMNIKKPLITYTVHVHAVILTYIEILYWHLMYSIMCINYFCRITELEGQLSHAETTTKALRTDSDNK